MTKGNEDALQAYLGEKVTAEEALEKAQVPGRRWMIKQTGGTEMKLVGKVSGGERTGAYLRWRGSGCGPEACITACGRSGNARWSWS